jgi:type I restriction enzyme R subunit
LVTDRKDLDGQLFETFADCSWSLRATPDQADEPRGPSREALGGRGRRRVLHHHQQVRAGGGKTSVPVLCERQRRRHRRRGAPHAVRFQAPTSDTRPARRKYGLAKYMRDALPNAIYLGMTGTPVSLDDRDTEAVFGTYVDVYDMIAAQEDEAIVPVSYESRIIELRFNEAEKQSLMDEFLEATEDEDEQEQNTDRLAPDAP